VAQSIKNADCSIKPVIRPTWSHPSLTQNAAKKMSYDAMDLLCLREIFFIFIFFFCTKVHQIAYKVILSDSCLLEHQLHSPDFRLWFRFRTK